MTAPRRRLLTFTLTLACGLAPMAASAAVVSGTVFEDRNGDGELGGGESGVAGWIVFIDADTDGVLDNVDGNDTCTAQASERCALTDASGAFSFSGLSEGPVQLRVVAQPEWRLTTDAAIDVLLLTDESVVANQRFGVFRLGAAEGTVFEDLDGDGTRQAAEPALEGWEVFVDANLDGMLDPGELIAESNADGDYGAIDLTLGVHALRLRNRCGFRLTVPPPPGRYVVSITASGQTITGRDFGLQRPAVLPGDGNGDGVVTAADLTAVALAIPGGVPVHGSDANQDGVVNAADLGATATNAFDCAGIAAAPVAEATATATATETATLAGPTATATVTPPPSTATATGAATATATRSASATATTAVTASPTASATATVPPTTSATPTITRTPTATGAPTPDAAALAGTAAQIANGMNAIPAVITALVSGIKFGGAALTYDPDAQLSGIGGPAGACPLGGSATSACSAGTTTVAFDGCKVPTASGSVTVDELPPTDPAVSLHGGLCIGKLALPPWNPVTIGVSAVFRDGQGAPLLTATAALTGSVNPSLGGSCQATGATLNLTGTISTQFADGSVTSITFANTGVVVAVTMFNPQCVPVKYTMTFNGPATVAVSGPPALVAGTIGETTTPVTFTNFVVAQDATGSPTLTELDGGLGSACAGASLTLDTTKPLAQVVGAQCPTDGTLKVSAGGSTAQLFYLAGGAVDLDANNDGTPESQLASCREAPPLCGGGNPTPTITRTPAATATRTATATTTATVTPGVPPTASATATSTATIPAVATATASGTRTLTPTPTPTATTAPEPEQFCDTLSSPALIPDNTSAGIDNTIVVQSARTIADLNVALGVAHTWVGDLTVTLTHVDTGKTVTLLDRPGLPASANGCGLDDIDAVFDDAALRPVEDRCAAGPPLAAAIDGSVKPQTPLSAFNGESLNGTWRLNVADLALQDTGSLLGWCLRPNSLVPVVTQYTCGQGDTACVVLVDTPFSESFSYSDADGDAESWHITAHVSGGSDFDAGSGSLASGSGGTVTLDFNPFTCPSQNCADTDVDYTITIQDHAGHVSPPMRLRLTVTLFQL